jgi:hypothetical protein
MCTTQEPCNSQRKYIMCCEWFNNLGISTNVGKKKVVFIYEMEFEIKNLEVPWAMNHQNGKTNTACMSYFETYLCVLHYPQLREY